VRCLRAELDREAESFPGSAKDHKVFYRMLRELGIFGDQAPGRLRPFRTAGQLSPGELVDRYQLQCQPVRDLLVDYLSERQPAIDYTSLKNLAYYLAQRFWADLEQHHPGIGSLHLAGDVAAAWKQRQRIKPKVITSAAGEKSVIMAERVGYRQCLTPVRSHSFWNRSDSRHNPAWPQAGTSVTWPVGSPAPRVFLSPWG
jgi:hypothetical protein